jgi:hypothetical protein
LTVRVVKAVSISYYAQERLFFSGFILIPPVKKKKKEKTSCIAQRTHRIQRAGSWDILLSATVSRTHLPFSRHSTFFSA